MRWEDESYVRLFVRDTTTWKLLPWQSKCLLPLLLRKLDWAGIADVGPNTVDGIAALTDMPTELVAAGLPELLRREVFVLRGGTLAMPNYLAAQTTAKSDRLRKREERARARSVAITKRDDESPNVTTSHVTGQNVTSGHVASEAVTSCPSGAGAGAGSIPCSPLSGTRPRARKPEPDAEPPEPGTPEREALDAILAEPNLRDAVVRPAQFAIELRAKYPAHALARHVARCAAWYRDRGRRIADGRRTLRNWLDGEAPDASPTGDEAPPSMDPPPAAPRMTPIELAAWKARLRSAAHGGRS